MAGESAFTEFLEALGLAWKSLVLPLLLGDLVVGKIFFLLFVLGVPYDSFFMLCLNELVVLFIISSTFTSFCIIGALGGLIELFVFELLGEIDTAF